MGMLQKVKLALLLTSVNIRFSFTRDWSKMTSPEALQILGSILGVPPEFGEFDTSFVITIDTLMKILSIQLRVRYGIPVIIMGMYTRFY